jgi:alkyldihydroxyacetonephosphate synthase
VGPENVQCDDYHRVKYSYGKLAEEMVSLKRGVLHAITDVVAHPRNKEDVRKIVTLCNEQRIPLYVYGGGSSATKGFLPEKGGITIVLNTHLNKVLEVNELNHTCRVQAGCMGPDLEHALNNAPELFHTVHRFTQGHFPQSFELSSVGGWVLTLGSGQASTYYGEPYNLVLSMEMITPTGTINTRDYHTTATGPKVLDMLKGSEGVFGVLVELTIKIFRYMPENRKYFGYVFPDWPAAVSAAGRSARGSSGCPRCCASRTRPRLTTASRCTHSPRRSSGCCRSAGTCRASAASAWARSRARQTSQSSCGGRSTRSRDSTAR